MESVKLVSDALKVMKKWGVVSTELLSRELGLPPPVVARLIEALKKSGVLVEEHCDAKCRSCPLSSVCGARGLRVKVYRLREPRKRVS